MYGWRETHVGGVIATPLPAGEAISARGRGDCRWDGHPRIRVRGRLARHGQARRLSHFPLLAMTARRLAKALFPERAQ